MEGRGRQKGVTLQWRTSNYNVDFLPKVKLEAVDLGFAVSTELPEEVHGLMDTYQFPGSMLRR